MKKLLIGLLISCSCLGVSCNIPNSINIPVEELEWEIEQLEDYKDKPILVYCRAGHRSVVACNILNDEGFEKLYNLSYGTLGYTGRLEPI